METVFATHGREPLPDESDTARLAAAFTASLSGGESVALDGPLGAGKTAFVRHVAAALGCRGPVSSPTYVLRHDYEGGALTVEHWDLYRLAGPPEELFDDVGTRSVRLVEWAERAAGRVAFDLRFVFSLDAEGRRSVEWGP